MEKFRLLNLFQAAQELMLIQHQLKKPKLQAYSLLLLAFSTSFLFLLWITALFKLYSLAASHIENCTIANDINISTVCRWLDRERLMSFTIDSFYMKFSILNNRKIFLL